MHLTLATAYVFTTVYLMTVDSCLSDFGCLGVACWPLVPKFVGSNPAEAVEFLGRKNP